VFVSSHLLQEMAVLADQLVVIGRGKMLANGAVDDFISHSSLGAVEVLSPDAELLRPALDGLDATVTHDGETLVVRGATAEQIGDAAHEAGVRLHQLVTRAATLEEAFLEATGLSEEFRGSDIDEGGRA
jgi:ABC-2 type transport system ATP-binding protein